ncbi:hypothetical protein D9M68_901860 [compost metagenome]
MANDLVLEYRFAEGHPHSRPFERLLVCKAGKRDRRCGETQALFIEVRREDSKALVFVPDEMAARYAHGVEVQSSRVGREPTRFLQCVACDAKACAIYRQ